MEEQNDSMRCERIRPGDDTLPTLTYRLYEGRVEGRASFSLQCVAPQGTALYESEAYLYDVTSDAATAEGLLFLLWEGAVTPYALAETVEEWLGG